MPACTKPQLSCQCESVVKLNMPIQHDTPFAVCQYSSSPGCTRILDTLQCVLQQSCQYLRIDNILHVHLAANDCCSSCPRES